MCHSWDFTVVTLECFMALGTERFEHGGDKEVVQ